MKKIVVTNNNVRYCFTATREYQTDISDDNGVLIKVSGVDFNCYFDYDIKEDVWFVSCRGVNGYITESTEKITNKIRFQIGKLDWSN